jgi:hypothetical protein
VLTSQSNARGGPHPSDPQSVRSRVSAGKLTFAHYLALFTLAVALPLIALAFIAADQVAEAQRDASRTALMTSARALAAAVDRELDNQEGVATTLARSGLLTSGDFRRRAREVLQIVLPGAEFSVCDPARPQLLSTMTETAATLPACRDTEALARSVATKKPQVSDLYADPIAQREILTEAAAAAVRSTEADNV